MLRSLRKRNLLTQKQACLYLGISTTYLSKIENGHRINLNKDLINKFCKLYNIETELFIYFLKK